MKTIRIGLAEDHDMVRQSLVRVIADYKDIEIVFEARDGQELFVHLEKKVIDIILLDVKMPVLDGKKAMVKLKKEFPKIKIIVVSAYSEDDLVLEYVRLGANGFLPKYSDLKQLMSAIYSTNQDGFYFEEATLDLLDKKGLSPFGGLKKLTSREISVLSFLCTGKSTKEIAFELNISESTVAGFKHRLFQKTGASDISGLINYAIKHRFLQGKKLGK